jgi:hypothetical protein
MTKFDAGIQTDRVSTKGDSFKHSWFVAATKRFTIIWVGHGKKNSVAT